MQHKMWLKKNLYWDSGSDSCSGAMHENVSSVEQRVMLCPLAHFLADLRKSHPQE